MPPGHAPVLTLLRLGPSGAVPNATLLEAGRQKGAPTPS